MIYIEIIGLVARPHLTKDVFLDFAGLHLAGLKSSEAIVPPQGRVSNMLGRIWGTHVHQQNGKTTQKLRWVCLAWNFCHHDFVSSSTCKC
jgi:hypothetical protein